MLFNVELTTSHLLLMLLCAFGGVIGGTFLSRYYWIGVYRIFVDEMHAQYIKILKEFGIRKTIFGVWEMHNRDEVWIKKTP